MTAEPLNTDTPGVGSPRRVEMLTHGVFAIVMTLIVLQIAIPTGLAAQLQHDLAGLVLTLLMLGIVALVPFSAGLLGRYPTAKVAVVVYGVHLTVVYAIHGCLWLSVSFRPELLRDGVSTTYRKWSRLASIYRRS